MTATILSWLRGFRDAVRDFMAGEYETEVASNRTGRREVRERERLRKSFLLADLDRRRQEVLRS